MDTFGHHSPFSGSNGNGSPFDPMPSTFPDSSPFINPSLTTYSSPTGEWANPNNWGSSSSSSGSNPYSSYTYSSSFDFPTFYAGQNVFSQSLPPFRPELAMLLATNRERGIRNPDLQNGADFELKSGWLTRVRNKSGLKSLFGSTEPKRRWVVLTPAALTYYDETKMLIIKRLYISKCIVGEVPGGIFRVKLAYENKDFRAADSAETKSWVTAIRSACVLNHYLVISTVTRQPIDNRLVTFVAGPPSDKLSLSTRSIGDHTLKTACELFRFSHATTLSITSAAGKDTLANVIMGLIKAHSGVRSIDLSDNGITDHGASYLASALLNNTTLVSLDLSKNKLTSVAASYFIHALQQGNKTIQEIILTGNPLTSDGDACTALAAEPRIKFLAPEGR